MATNLLVGSKEDFLLPNEHPDVMAELHRRQELKAKADTEEPETKRRKKDEPKSPDKDKDTGGKWKQMHVDLAEKRTTLSTHSVYCRVSPTAYYLYRKHIYIVYICPF